MTPTDIERARIDRDAAEATDVIAMGGGALSARFSAAGLSSWRSKVKASCRDRGVKVRTGFTNGKKAVFALGDGEIAQASLMGMTSLSFLRMYGGSTDGQQKLYPPSTPMMDRIVTGLVSAHISQPDDPDDLRLARVLDSQGELAGPPKMPADPAAQERWAIKRFADLGLLAWSRPSHEYRLWLEEQAIDVLRQARNVAHVNRSHLRPACSMWSWSNSDVEDLWRRAFSEA